MNPRRLALVTALAVCSSAARADEAVNKLMSGHQQSLRSARLPLHRKLLSELQKLQTQYQKAGNALALSEVDTEIARVKEWITEASLPVAGGAGPQPSDFKLIYYSGVDHVFGSLDNGDLKVESKGFTWVNNSSQVEVINPRVLTGAFEAQITYSGAAFFSAMEADYTKYTQMYIPLPVDNGKHTLKLKRNAAGAMTLELDGKPAALTANGGARPDMYVRLSLRVMKGAKLELREMNIKDLSAKK